MEDGPPVVAKFYRPARWSDAAILEEHAFVAELAEREIPVVPRAGAAAARTLHHFDGFRFAVFPSRGGRAPELDDRHDAGMDGALHRPHSCGRRAASLSRHGRRWISRASARSRATICSRMDSFRPNLRAPTQRGDQALDGVRRCFDAPARCALLRLHGDCHAGNVLWTDAGPHFVDFDDSRMGPAVQDLWMLLSGERAEMVRQLADVLAGYEDFCEFDPRELHLVEALRTLRLLHYSAWLARRWDDPAFPAAFPWFNTQRYWQDRILELREQVALMDEPPLWPA